MTRKEFMEQLENMLENIQDSEREEAMQYYNDYFDEAGKENEDQVIHELGTPAKVAAIIKTSLQENENTAGEFSERGYTDPRFVLNYEVVDRKESDQEENNKNKTYYRERKNAKEPDWGKITLIIILCVFAIPILAPVLGGLIGVIVGIIGIAFGLFVAIAASTVGLLGGGIGVFVVGIVTLFASPATGIFCLGIGLLLFGFGILLLLLTIYIGYHVIPWLIRGIVNLCKIPFNKRRNV